MIKSILFFILFILSIPVCSGFIPKIDNNTINKLYNLPKPNYILININKQFFKPNKNTSKNISTQLQKYKPFYKIIYKLELVTTIRFKTLVIIFILLRTIYSLYSNISDIVNIISMIDEKDIKEVNKILQLLNFINLINIFNIITFLELYEKSETIQFINKKSLLYKKYIKLYKKDCFIIKYI
jgi:hypothetical protein